MSGPNHRTNSTFGWFKPAKNCFFFLPKEPLIIEDVVRNCNSSDELGQLPYRPLVLPKMKKNHKNFDFSLRRGPLIIDDAVQSVGIASVSLIIF